jgi:hypothetical protein
MERSEWWKDFFSGLTVDMWRQAVTADQTGFVDFHSFGNTSDEPFAFGAHALYVVAHKGG